ncbi:hypothetical protein ACK8N7_33625 [Streptomyces griseobrunneus]
MNAAPNAGLDIYFSHRTQTNHAFAALSVNGSFGVNIFRPGSQHRLVPQEPPSHRRGAAGEPEPNVQAVTEGERHSL